MSEALDNLVRQVRGAAPISAVAAQLFGQLVDAAGDEGNPEVLSIAVDIAHRTSVVVNEYYR